MQPQYPASDVSGVGKIFPGMREGDMSSPLAGPTNNNTPRVVQPSMPSSLQPHAQQNQNMTPGAYPPAGGYGGVPPSHENPAYGSYAHSAFATPAASNAFASLQVRSSPFGATPPPNNPPPQEYPQPIVLPPAQNYGNFLAPPPTQAEIDRMREMADKGAPSRQSLSVSRTSSGRPRASKISFRSDHSSNYTDFQSKFNRWEDFVRPSFFRLPNSKALATRINLPMGFVLQPLAPILEGQEEVPVIPLLNDTIVRCSRCRAYMNPFITFSDNGKRWTCNICGGSSDVPSHYQCGLNEAGVRYDRDMKPELSCSSVEYMAPEAYSIRPSYAPSFLFILDVSMASVNSQFLQCAVQGIVKTLRAAEFAPGTLVGIMTYDSGCHFYDLSKENPPLIVMGDPEDPFLPTPSVLVEIAEHVDSICTFLEGLPERWKTTDIRETCMGAAIQVGLDGLRAQGGKIAVFSSQMSVLGPPTLQQDPKRNNPGFITTDKESELLRPANEAYAELGENLATHAVSCDLFVGSRSPNDLATVAPMVSVSGGDLHYYQNFTAAKHGRKLHGDVFHTLQRVNVWEAAMRVRVSKGWHVKDHFGHFNKTSGDLLIIPNQHEFQSYSVVVELDQSVAPETSVYMQVAVLFTHEDLSRRVRVHTWNCPVSSDLSEVVQSIDSEALTVLLSHRAIDMAIKAKISDARNYIEDIVRRVVSLHSVSSECLQLLPVDMLGVLKSVALAGYVLPDERIYHFFRLQSSSVPLTAVYYYPRLVCLSNMTEDVMELDEVGRPALPPMLNLCMESLTPDGIYLIENGENMIVLVGEQPDPQLLGLMFGTYNLADLDHEEFSAHFNNNLLRMKTDQSIDPYMKKIVDLIGVFREERLPSTMHLEVLRRGGPRQEEAFQYFVEDATKAVSLSYRDFMRNVAGVGAAQRKAMGRGEKSPAGGV